MTPQSNAITGAMATLSLLASLATYAGALEPVSAMPLAPALHARDLDARERSLSDFAGEVLLINFWAGWCAPCLHEMPALQRLAERFEGRPFQVLAVNVGEDARRVRETLRRLDYRGMALLDRESAAFDAWGIDVLPTSFVVDRQRRIRLRGVGELDWDDKEVDRAIEEIIESHSTPLD
ncbi:MAG: TlpA disulfide reductase family protein [Anderseniella sp.]|jgi:thiol-disulfide isomerase/thioredoxin|nr:TlpA disulfide reductase family protein [Anderseniella sp.]